MDFAIILSDVEVDRPGTQFVGHLFVGSVELFVRISVLEQRMLRCVVSHQVQVSVREVRLETERLRHANLFEQVQHVFPAVHTCPADFTFGRETFAAVRSDFCGFLEGGSDLRGVGGGVSFPSFDTKLGRVDANHTIVANSVIIEDASNSASHFYSGKKLILLLLVAHSRVTDGARPYWSDQRSDFKTLAGDHVGDLLQIVVGGFRVGVRQEEKVVDALVLLTAYFRSCG